jgi:metallophosphoesterase superfamily enzyme
MCFEERVKIEPLLDTPVLVVKNEVKTLVTADLHIGIEYDLYKSGIRIPSQTQKQLAKLIDHIEKIDPDRILLLGDVKHNVPLISYQERGDVPKFLGELAKLAPIDIVPGNHDGNLGFLIPKDADITLHSSRGILRDDIGYFHGHAWPSANIISAKHVVMAHNHPAVQFIDKLGYRSILPAWIRVNFDENVIRHHYSITADEKISQCLTIMPAFNELCGGIPFNEASHEDLLGPISTSGAIKLEGAEVYLLDGTYIGKIRNLRRLG